MSPTSNNIASGITQVASVDYSKTFALVAKTNSLRVLSIAAIRHWTLHQLDVKNIFLHGDLHEKVYMHLPLGFYPQRKGAKGRRPRLDLIELQSTCLAT